jgi:hypothetical protein
MILFAVALWGLLRPLLQDIKYHGGVKKMASGFGLTPNFDRSNVFSAFLLCIIAYMMWEASHWNLYAKIVPMIVGSMAFFFCSASLLNAIFRRPEEQAELGLGSAVKGELQQKIHMDLESDTTHVPTNIIWLRATIFFGWLVVFMASMAVIGLIPTVPIFVVAYMRLEGPEKWRLVIPQAVGLTLFIWYVFDQLLTIPWPPTYLGSWFPAFKMIPSV